MSGAGRLYTTLAEEGHRHVTFSGQIYNPASEKERLYPTHFCRSCGQEFHPVTLRQRKDGQLFEKREIEDVPSEEADDEQGTDWGFLMPEPNNRDFTFEDRDTDYPALWVETTPKGETRLKATYRKTRGRSFTVAVSRSC